MNYFKMSTLEIPASVDTKQEAESMLIFIPSVKISQLIQSIN